MLLRIGAFGGGTPTHEQRVRGREALREMRLALQRNFEPTVSSVQRVHSALHHLAPIPGPPENPFADAPFTKLMDDLESDFELGRLVVVEGAVPLLGVAPEFELTTKAESPPVEPPLPPIRTVVCEPAGSIKEHRRVRSCLMAYLAKSTHLAGQFRGCGMRPSFQS